MKISARTSKGNDILPTDMRTLSSSNYDLRAILEAAGVQFLGVVEGDALFQRVNLPRGWNRVKRDRLWSDLVDERGRTRAQIFYRAKRSWRRATIFLETRFFAGLDCKGKNPENAAVGWVKDQGMANKVIHATDPISIPVREYDDEYTAEENEDMHSAVFEYHAGRAYDAAVEWLGKNYPDWENPGAYWD